MLVKATSNPVAREDNSTRYITDVPVEVPESSYYLRRVMDGELVVVKAAPTVTSSYAGPTPMPPAVKEED